MIDRAKESSEEESADNGLDDFEGPPDDHGLSLDQLSQAYADLIQSGADPYDTTHDDEEGQRDEDIADETGGEAAAATDSFEVTPRSILEAILFVGTPENSPLTSKQIASLMRGVRAEEIDELVGELNASYAVGGCPYTIASVGAGYQMVLRDELASLRDRFYGRVKEARLSQAAIDVLAIVAYNQPLTREEVDELRGKPSSKLLTQLVRRQLLGVDRPDEQPRKTLYYTTERFLDLFGLESIADLPQSQELDRAT